MNDSTDEKPRWLVWARDAGIVLLILIAVMTYQTWNHVGHGQAAPSFDLERLGGGEGLSTSSLMGKPTVLYFWAPWCSVCEASSSNVSAVHDAVGDDANVVSVALEYRSLDSVRDFATRNDARYPVFLGNEAVRDAYSVTAFPTLYVLDDEGHVSSSVVGYTTELGIRARLWWASI